ncbi:hypothetical protein [Methylomonas methanica]|uniref:Uncharacterized protein n=1 Tax=Methylomonas methanica TaxID=421 RepID=A0A177MHS2_METMH|nr:hypothetical protein [Methylomonas methanica]OAI04903.1 hypothetical protein A1332_13840 [Methylomonas methanica]
MYMIEELEALANELPALITAQKTALQMAQQQMTALKDAGLIYANEYWRDDKYMYLNYPTEGDGKRQRRYVGCDPERIQAARDGIQRAQDYDRLLAETRKIESLLLQGKGRLREAVNTLAGKSRW